MRWRALTRRAYSSYRNHLISGQALLGGMGILLSGSFGAHLDLRESHLRLSWSLGRYIRKARSFYRVVRYTESKNTCHFRVPRLSHAKYGKARKAQKAILLKSL